MGDGVRANADRGIKDYASCSSVNTLWCSGRTKMRNYMLDATIKSHAATDDPSMRSLSSVGVMCWPSASRFASHSQQDKHACEALPFKAYPMFDAISTNIDQYRPISPCGLYHAMLCYCRWCFQGAVPQGSGPRFPWSSWFFCDVQVSLGKFRSFKQLFVGSSEVVYSHLAFGWNVP